MNAANNQRPVPAAKLAFCAISTKSNVSTPVSRRAKNAVATIPTSMKAEPAMVYKKNLVAAYTRFSYPQPPIRKYIGTNTISKNTKNKNRSRLRKLPMTPASSSSIHAKYDLWSWCGSMPTITSGNNTPVSTTINSEIPSTPKCHEMPHSLIHECFDTNSKPAAPVGNLTSIHTLIAPVAMLDASAASLTHSPCFLFSNETRTAPSNGIRTSIVKIGKLAVASPAISAEANIR